MSELLSHQLLPGQYGFERLDLKENPGFGETYATPEERTDRCLRVARWYFQGFTDAGELDWTHVFGQHPEWIADNATVFWSAFTPPPAQPVPYRALTAASANGKVPLAVREGRAMRTMMPDFGTVPGSFRAMPWENGVTFSMIHGGTRASGERVDMWELNTVLLDEKGLLLHWDNWANERVLEEMFQANYGHSFQGLDFATYSDEIDAKLAQAT